MRNLCCINLSKASLYSSRSCVELFDGLIFGLKSDVLLPKLLTLRFKLRASLILEFSIFGLEFGVFIGKRLRLLSKQLKQLRFRK